MDRSAPSWDIQRFWRTLDYFDSIPILSCLQKLMNGNKKTIDPKAGETVLVIGGEGVIGRKIMPALLDKNVTVRALVRDIAACRGFWGENVDLFAFDAALPLVGVDRVIYCFDTGSGEEVAEWRRWGEIAAAIGKERVLFDFSEPNGDIRSIWGAVDDVVMGGVSESELFLSGGKGVFAGEVRTENNGGFASVRTRNFDPPLELSGYEGIRLEAKGDGNRYKFIVRCEGRWDGVGYNYSFDTEAGRESVIEMPFGDFRPLFRARTVSDAPPLGNDRIFAFQLMLSKFEYDGALNPRFRPGAFRLELGKIAAYGPEVEIAGVSEGGTIDGTISPPELFSLLH